MHSCTNFRVVLQILGTNPGNMRLNSTYELWNLSPKIITLAKTFKIGGKDLCWGNYSKKGGDQIKILGAKMGGHLKR